MKLKSYIREHNTNIKELAKSTGIPYSTLNDIVNGKTDILRVRLGIVLEICEALSISVEEICQMCASPMPERDVPDERIYVRNKCYYLKYDEDGVWKSKYLCKVNRLNTEYVGIMAEWELQDIRGEETLRQWQQTII